MTFIDWSDSEGMLDLLIDFVSDAKNESQDSSRADFLASLLADLTKLNKQFATIPGKQVIDRLRTIYSSIDPEFKYDPVMLHVDAFIEELECLHNRSAT